MLDYRLFLGVPLDERISLQLMELPAAVRDSFIQAEDSSPYLQQIVYEGITYLGKALGPSFETQALAAMKEHLLSLIHRLVPNLSYADEAVILFAIPLPLADSV